MVSADCGCAAGLLPCGGTCGSYPAGSWLPCSGWPLWSSRSAARSLTAARSWRDTRERRVPASCLPVCLSVCISVCGDTLLLRQVCSQLLGHFQVVKRRTGCRFKDGEVGGDDDVEALRGWGNHLGSAAAFWRANTVDESSKFQGWLGCSCW